MLVWNLENFTRDLRPAGTSSLDSPKNQARIDLVARTMQHLEVDALLMMETGGDVGTVTSRIAASLAKAGGAKNSFDALTSPETGPMPAFAPTFETNKILRNGDAAMAITALSGIYDIVPVSMKQGNPSLAPQAWQVLRHSSAKPVRDWIDRYELVKVELGKDNAGAWFKRVLEALPDLAEQQEKRYNAIAQEIADWALPVYQAKGIGLALCDAILELRNIASRAASEDVNHDDDDDESDGGIDGSHSSASSSSLGSSSSASIGTSTKPSMAKDKADGVCMEMALLLLLSLLPEDEAAAGLWKVHSIVDSETTPALSAYLAVFSETLKFDSIDPEINPLDGTFDSDVMRHSLERIGSERRHTETYGLLYRPPFDGALDQLLTPATSDGKNAYRIVQSSSSNPGQSIASQTFGSILEGRSALSIAIPVSPKLKVAVYLFHNRFSGSQLITETYKKQDVKTAAEAAVRARMDTLADLAKNTPEAGGEKPLIVGDFNIPSAYLEQAKDGSSRVKQRKIDAGKELSKVMNKYGYFRYCLSDGGFAKTTLKSIDSIAKDGELLSEPYDGVYQPFGLDVACRVGVVQLNGIFGGQPSETEAWIAATGPSTSVTVPTQASASSPAPVLSDAECNTLADEYIAPLKGLLARAEYASPVLQIMKRREKGVNSNKAKAQNKSEGEIVENHELTQAISKFEYATDKAKGLIELRRHWFYDSWKNGSLKVYSDDSLNAFDEALSELAETGEYCEVTTGARLFELLKKELACVRNGLTSLETEQYAREALLFRVRSKVATTSLSSPASSSSSSSSHQPASVSSQGNGASDGVAATGTAIRQVYNSTLSNVYASWVRQVMKELDGLAPWIAEPRKTRASSVHRSFDLVATLEELQRCWKELRRFAESPAEEDAHNVQPRKDLLILADDLKKAVKEANAAHGKDPSCAGKPSPFGTLQSKAITLHAKLSKLNDDAKCRLAVAYRKIVSDHLPVLVEFQFEKKGDN